MSELISVKANIDISGLGGQFENLCQDQELKLSMNQTLAKDCDPYVPFLTGDLSQTLNITPDYVEYTQPYAHYQYHGTEFNHTLDYHPLATAKWDKAMLENNKENFEEELQGLMVRRYRELYGGN